MTMHKDARSRMGPLDVLTVLVLALAAGLAIHPQSLIRATITTWWEDWRFERAVNREWAALTGMAIPLYQGGAPPHVIEFSDYECPFCRASSPAVDSALQAGVRIAMIHLPLPFHARARPAALATLCAARAGHLGSLHRFLMTNKDWLSDSTKSLVPDSGGLRQVVNECLRREEAESVLVRHEAIAKALKVRGTPTFVSQSHVLKERPTRERLIALVTR